MKPFNFDLWLKFDSSLDSLGLETFYAQFKPEGSNKIGFVRPSVGLYGHFLELDY